MSNTVYERNMMDFKHENLLLVLIYVCHFHHHHPLTFPQILLISSYKPSYSSFFKLYNIFQHFPNLHWSFLTIFCHFLLSNHIDSSHILLIFTYMYFYLSLLVLTYFYCKSSTRILVLTSWIHASKNFINVVFLSSASQEIIEVRVFRELC